MRLEDVCVGFTCTTRTHYHHKVFKKKNPSVHSSYFCASHFWELIQKHGEEGSAFCLPAFPEHTSTPGSISLIEMTMHVVDARRGTKQN